MFLMSIGNVFKRYERWNPVHPTNGAFWGLGIGAGCGVGWGPGFGPDVVGYVGSGCGLGFSVGVTFVGIGIGLPASGLIAVPSHVISAAGYGMFELAKNIVFPAISDISNYGSGVNHLSKNLSVDAEDDLEIRLERFSDYVLEKATKNFRHTLEGFQCVSQKNKKKKEL